MTETTNDPQADEDAVRSTLDAYFEWSRTGSDETFARAFHPQATVVNASNGDARVTAWTGQQFAEGVAALREAAGGVEESARAISVEVIGNVACARVEFDLQIGDTRNVGTEYMTVARVGDRWLITHKAYDSDRPYTGPPK